MATLSSIMVGDSSGDASGTITTGTSAGGIAIAKRRIFSINANQDISIKFGLAGVTATASNFRIPSGSTFTFDMGDANDHIDLFNNSGSTATYWITFNSKF